MKRADLPRLESVRGLWANESASSGVGRYEHESHAVAAKPAHGRGSRSPGYEVSAWFGLFSPAGTPEAIVNRLSAAAVEAVQSPSLKGRLIERGYIPVGSTAA